MLNVDDLLARYGDGVMGLDHRQYEEMALAACGSNPATLSAIRMAATDPARRLTNVIRGRVLRHCHQNETGEGAEMDRRDLQLF